MTKIAQMIKNHLTGFRGHAALYKLDPPMKSEPWEEGDAVEIYHYVVASAIDDEYITECYLFPADEEGNITCWMEQHGSMKGTTDHEACLNLAGYDVLPLSLE